MSVKICPALANRIYPPVALSRAGRQSSDKGDALMFSVGYPTHGLGYTDRRWPIKQQNQEAFLSNIFLIQNISD
ncbi:MAG: hypothetical protein V7K18_03545 [Nostoc sp.]|uniref:hypothetical protein n=1 Tax=Nostoc sp. TaxID=1180 RepID=UPI002FFC73DC